MPYDPNSNYFTPIHTLCGLLLHLTAVGPLPCSLSALRTPGPCLHHPHIPCMGSRCIQCSWPYALQPSEKQ